MSTSLSRKRFLQGSAAAVAAALVTSREALANIAAPSTGKPAVPLSTVWDKTFIHGEKAQSRYFSEAAFAAAAQPKELLIIPGANHVDLYDRLDVIPFDSMAAFFETNLKPAGAGHV